MIYGPNLCANNAMVRSNQKPESPDYDTYQKYQHSYSSQEHSPEVNSHLQLMPGGNYPTFGENRAPRGPLASFTKPKDYEDYGMGRLINAPRTPSIHIAGGPPVPAHQIPLTPSILKGPPNPMLFQHPPLPSEPKGKVMVPPITPSTPIFERTENTGTIKRQKPKATTPGNSDTLEKPLKSALKSRSAYDKPKHKETNPLHVGIVQPTSRPDAGVPSPPQSTSSFSSTSPSVASSGGFSSPTEFKGILIKRSDKPKQNDFSNVPPK